MRAFTGAFDFVIFLGRSLTLPRDLRRTLPRIVEQIYNFGVGAVPIVILASLFVGLTTAVQTSYQLLGIVPRYFIGMGVGRMLLIELGPVFSAFIFASRSASAMAAEIGAMRNSDQIDALRVMGIDPYRFLCQPRIIAAAVSLPILVVIMEIVASLTAVVVAGFVGVTQETFVYGLTHFVQARDFVGGIIKAIIFGLFIGASGCYFGFNAEGGAQEVGRATTRAVVWAGILILFFDFVIAVLMFSR
ncbi:MAG: ABC transporter permease [candidate division WOR-3 bacterium]|jgi:phospholipid/cholesterol/gamma-HCH transport system permease protein|nr:ABC transporter permease [candidate division WOR-3 bacterium]MCR4423450.1 ABC transporter permease [candidate division WOR-3 bacterium]MDH7518789.1 ABC transporter permease [bacterium]